MALGLALLDGLTFLLVVSILGAAILASLAPRASHLLAPAVGIAAAALLVNGLYFGLDLPVRYGSAALLLSTLIGAGALGRLRLQQLTRAAPQFLSLYLVLFLPAVLGGLQYCVFRGNHWDHFNYIDMAIAMSMHRHSELVSRPLADFIDNDVVVHGIGLMGGRPAASLLFASFLPWGLGDLHLNAFAWNTALWGAAFPSAIALWRLMRDNSGGGAQSGVGVMPVFALLGGFWGQYIFDINAWSQLAAMPVMIAATVQFTRCFAGSTIGANGSVDHIGRQCFVLAFLIAGAFLIYPEQTVLQAAVIGLALVLHLSARRDTPPWRSLLWLSPSLAVLMAVAVAPNAPATLGLVVQQIQFGRTGDPDWYHYFDRYWLGVPGIYRPLDASLNFPVAVSGMYPLAWVSTGEANLWPWAGLTVVSGGALAMLVFVVFVHSLRWRGAESRAVQYLRWLSLACAALVAWMLSRHHIWVAGKALSYFVPYLLLPMCLPAAAGAPGFVRRSCAAYRVLFLACQVGFAIFRPMLAMTPQGIGYAQTWYPSIQDVSLKTMRSWRMDTQGFSQCRHVAIMDHVSTVRTEFVKQRLSYAGIAFTGPGPVTAHYQPGAAVVGTAVSPPADCALVFAQHGAKAETIERLSLPYCDWFAMDQKGQMLALQGFGQPEGWGVWMAAPVAHIHLPVPLRGMVVVAFDIGMVYPAAVGKTVTVAIGRAQTAFTADVPGIHELTFDLGDQATSTIDIAIPVTETPASRGESADPRLLGIGITRLRAGSCAKVGSNGLQH